VKAHHCCRLLCFIDWNRPLSRSKYGHIKTNRAINNQLFLLGPLDKIMDIETAPVLIILISALYRTLLLRADKNSSWYHKQHRIRNNGGITSASLSNPGTTNSSVFFQLASLSPRRLILIRVKRSIVLTGSAVFSFQIQYPTPRVSAVDCKYYLVDKPTWNPLVF
jgi:hypothetical protein